MNQPADSGRIASRSRELPDFEAPPAVETYLGVHFDPIENWKIPHFGLFWAQIKGHYSKMEVRPPLAVPSSSRGAVALEFALGVPQGEIRMPVRCWFINEDETRLLQVQDNLFIHNWRRPGGSEEPYSHYDNLRPIFEEEWGRFTDFVQGQKVGKINATMCEVAYINHLDRGVGWKSFADLPNVFPCWSGLNSGSFLPAPQAVTLSAFYPMKQPEGQLQISLQPAIRQADRMETLQLTVTGRCKPTGSGPKEILSALDSAREWVVRGFTDFTSDNMHKIWERTI